METRSASPSLPCPCIALWGPSRRGSIFRNPMKERSGSKPKPSRRLAHAEENGGGHRPSSEPHHEQGGFLVSRRGGGDTAPFIRQLCRINAGASRRRPAPHGQLHLPSGKPTHHSSAGARFEQEDGKPPNPSIPPSTIYEPTTQSPA